MGMLAGDGAVGSGGAWRAVGVGRAEEEVWIGGRSGKSSAGEKAILFVVSSDSRYATRVSR
jgi:hypothetical protein